LHTLGNLTLTGYNTPLSNDDFPTKRRILLNSHLELNGYFEHVLKWDDACIRLRADALVERALKIWPNLGVQEIPPGDVKRRVPTAVVVLGKRIPVNSWRDVAQQTFELLAEMDRERFGEVVNKFPRFFGKDATKFRASRQLSNGIYMLTHLSGTDITKLCTQVTEAVGLSSEDWTVEFAKLEE
jgi:hypothetical protein